MIYFELFLSFLQIGLISVGGGYAAIPLIQQQAVEIHAWITAEEFADLITIAETTPGPLGINTATFVGIQTGGVLGAIVATFAYVLPAFIILISLALLFKRYKNISAVQGVLSGLRPVIVALIASAAITILLLALRGSASEEFSLVQILIFAAGFSIFRIKKINPIFIMVGAGVVSLALYYAGML